MVAGGRSAAWRAQNPDIPDTPIPHIGIPHIGDILTYNINMEKSMLDKLFFLDKVDADLFVDFGCANGALIRAISQLFPIYDLFGYDVSDEMIKLAQKDLKARAIFDQNWNYLLSFVNESKTENPSRKSALILSSVLHEIYSYLSPDEIKDFWDKVWNSGFDYIIIRDMMVSESAARHADPIAVAKIRQIFDRRKIRQWEAQWGTLNDNWSLVHFLLTYRYDTNWDRELKENYLPNSLETFMKMIPLSYSPSYFDHSTLPFLREVVSNDFGIQLQDRTHLKLILKKQ